MKKYLIALVVALFSLTASNAPETSIKEVNETETVQGYQEENVVRCWCCGMADIYWWYLPSIGTRCGWCNSYWNYYHYAGTSIYQDRNTGDIIRQHYYHAMLGNTGNGASGAQTGPLKIIEVPEFDKE